MKNRLLAFLQRNIMFAATLPPVAYLLISIIVTHPLTALIPALLMAISAPIFFVLIGLSLAFDLIGMKFIPEDLQMPAWVTLVISWILFFAWVL